MANCSNIAGYVRGCDRSSGGIKKIAFFEWAGLDLTGATITAGVISGLTVYTGYSGYTYDFLEDNSNFTFPAIGDGLLASTSWQQTVTLIFRKLSTTLLNEMYELSKTKFVAIVQDFNDGYWFLGKDKGLRKIASAGGQSGQLLGDLNGYTLVMQANEPHTVYLIDISATSSVDAKILALFGY